MITLNYDRKLGQDFKERQQLLAMNMFENIRFLPLVSIFYIHFRRMAANYTEV